MSLEQAVNHLKNNDFAAARDLIARADAATYKIPHFLIKGLSELALKDWQAARQTFADATAHFPDHALFWLNRGIAEERLLLLDAAIASQEKCLKLNPAQGEACGNLSNLYRHKKRFAEAEQMAHRALANGASKGDALNCLGLALCKQGKFDAARAAFQQAHEAAPANAAILSNHANLETEILNFDAAWPLFAAARALSSEPVIRHDEALARLLSGDYERGLPLFESRLDLSRALRTKPDCPRWQGESLIGKKLLIIAEQGFGDVIQFCRYGENLPDGDLVWAVPKNLVRLLSGNVRGAVIDETTPLPACDYYVPIISLMLLTKKYPLPLAGRVREGREPQKPSLLLKDIPTATAGDNTETSPFLHSPLPNPPREGEGTYLSAPTSPKLPPGKHDKKIGIVWAGSPTHERDHERSIPLRLFAPLLKEIAADFYAPFVGDELSKLSSPESAPIPLSARLRGERGDTELSAVTNAKGVRWEPQPHLTPLSDASPAYSPASLSPASPAERNANTVPFEVNITSLAPLITDFADTAALLRQLDCLITVDTAAAHLAGALGVKTYLLLQHCPDWRWGVSGETTTWYPSLTLIRQEKYGDWKEVIDRLTDLLKRRFRKPA